METRVYAMMDTTMMEQLYVNHVMSHVKLVLDQVLTNAQAAIQPALIVTIIAALGRVLARMGSIRMAMRYGIL